MSASLSVSAENLTNEAVRLRADVKISALMICFYSLLDARASCLLQFLYKLGENTSIRGIVLLIQRCRS